MEHKCVYVLTSNGRDLYSAMTQVSAVSFALTNKGRILILACDRCTYRTLTREGDPLLGLFHDVVVEDVTGDDAVFRNRWVKTKLRNLIDGPFLYLDSDTLVRGPLELSLSDHTDFAAAPNHSVAARDQQIWSEDAAFLEKQGWKTRPDVYVNGGVLFFNESEGAYKLSECWHKLWLEAGGRTGKYRDQPALNAALARTSVNIETLDDRLNAQFKTNPKIASNATIWHYYGSGTMLPTTNFEDEVHSIVEGNALDMRRVYSMINKPYPWRLVTPLDTMAATEYTKSADSDDWTFAWLARRPISSKYVRIVSALLKKFDRKIYVWGTGSFGRLINKEIEAIGGSSEGFLTSYPEKEMHEIDNKRIIDGYSIIRLPASERSRNFILIANQFQSEILPALNQEGLVSHVDFIVLIPLNTNQCK